MQALREVRLWKEVEEEEKIGAFKNWCKNGRLRATERRGSIIKLKLELESGEEWKLGENTKRT